MMGWLGWGVPTMWIGMGLFWVLLIAAIVWLVVEVDRPKHFHQAPNSANGFVPGGPIGGSPLEVLDRRLATGQVDLVTYQQVRAALLQSRATL
ncbi:MAG: hypothetical protein J0I40_00815 [Cellulomonas sp.]|uniref:SHOCT domain-containing protein n=1 Tax=Cellulomonas sp. 73-92 TaxID=1895740 RepID=UPI000A55DA87|nr:hypothetical protein [Cellulomonas sp. 73-92]MBN9373938.1 hypothetical protein [Cellulomonas sp.]